MKMNKKILLAIDGSEQFFTAVRYISRVFSKQTEVVLFHVEAEVPEAFRDLAVDPSTGFVDCKLKLLATAGKSGRGYFYLCRSFLKS